MIPASLAEIAWFYAAGTVGLLALGWLVHLLGRARAAKVNRRTCVQCALCGTEYEAGGSAELPRCPACAHPNERVASRFF